METVGNKLLHGIGLHNHVIFLGSKVKIMVAHPRLVKADYDLLLQVKDLTPRGAVLDINDVDMVIPLTSLLLCRTETDRIDSMGYPLNVGDNVTIGAYGGAISKNDIGAKGVIEKLNRKTATVSFYSNYDKVRNIPFDYLRK